MKRDVHITGKVLFPLQEGSSAVIFHAGQIIRTSTVEKIHIETDDVVQFESSHTLYTVSNRSVPYATRIPAFMRMCA